MASNSSAPTAFPPPPSPSVDWSHIAFDILPTAGHIITTYSIKTQQWTPPKFTSDPILQVHGFSPALNYAQSCYEGLKAFRQKLPSTNGFQPSPSTGGALHSDEKTSEQIIVFRPSKNAARMQHSAAILAMPPVPTALFELCVKLAVSHNAAFVPPSSTGAALYIRPLLFGSGAMLKLVPPQEYTLVVFVVPTGVVHGTKANDALILTEFDRAAPNGVGHAKVAGNYAPVYIWQARAAEEGFGITLHLDSKTGTEVDEFSTSAFLGVREKEGKVQIVNPTSRNAIQSVTADSIREISSKVFGWEVVDESVTIDKLEGFTEVMACGTAAAVVPIGSISLRKEGEKEKKWKYSVGADGGPGKYVKMLSDEYKGIQRGERPDELGWCEVIREPWSYEKEVEDVGKAKLRTEKEGVAVKGRDGGDAPAGELNG